MTKKWRHPILLTVLAVSGLSVFYGQMLPAGSAASDAPAAQVIVAPASAKDLPQDILGLQLDMGEAEATKRLTQLGKLEREEGRKRHKREEVWALKEGAFSHIVIGYNEFKLRYITAVARPDAPHKMRYSDVADTTQATQQGDPQHNNFHYVWSVEAQGQNPKMLIVVRGRDPQYLETFSLKRL